MLFRNAGFRITDEKLAFAAGHLVNFHDPVNTRDFRDIFRDAGLE